MKQNEPQPDWVRYYKVISYEWSCPLCDYLNSTTTNPDFSDSVRCFKCGKHFDNIRCGDTLPWDYLPNQK